MSDTYMGPIPIENIHPELVDALAEIEKLKGLLSTDSTSTLNDAMFEIEQRDAVIALQSANPWLVPVSSKNNSLIAAAKNARIELKRAFPGVTFSVKTSRFSMGDDMRVTWVDGPTADQVDAIIDRYAGGSFDGMTDSYNYTQDTWTDAFGKAKYVFSQRQNSDKALESAIRTVKAAL